MNKKTKVFALILSILTVLILILIPTIGSKKNTLNKEILPKSEEKTYLLDNFEFTTYPDLTEKENMELSVVMYVWENINEISNIKTDTSNYYLNTRSKLDGSSLYENGIYVLFDNSLSSQEAYNNKENIYIQCENIKENEYALKLLQNNKDYYVDIILEKENDEKYSVKVQKEEFENIKEKVSQITKETNIYMNDESYIKKYLEENKDINVIHNYDTDENYKLNENYVKEFLYQ